MAVLKSADNGELIVSCNCGCDEGIHMRINKDDWGDFSILTYTNGNFYKDQNDSVWQLMKKKCKKIWAIIANKDFYYSDIIMNGDEFAQFKEYVNSVEANKSKHDGLNTVYCIIDEVHEQGKIIKEEDVLKFYYIDSEDKYVVGQRLDTMYYAEVTERFSLAYYMSRYLPWGEHVVDEKSAWKEHTYCSEPREIPFTEWLKGFMEQQTKARSVELQKGDSK